MDLTSFFEDIVQPQFILSHYIMSTKFQDGSIKENVERGSNKKLSVVCKTEDSMYDAAKRAVDQLVMKVEDGWVCKTCDKKTKGTSSQIRKHAEIHIEGLSFPCNLCEKTIRSRDILKHHKTKHYISIFRTRNILQICTSRNVITKNITKQLIDLYCRTRKVLSTHKLRCCGSNIQ